MVDQSTYANSLRANGCDVIVAVCVNTLVALKSIRFFEFIFFPVFTSTDTAFNELIRQQQTAAIEAEKEEQTLQLTARGKDMDKCVSLPHKVAATNPLFFPSTSLSSPLLNMQENTITNCQSF